MNDANDQNPQATPDQTGASPVDATEDEASVVWLVSYSDDDDRELRAPQIAEALRRGEINGETIVWRQGAEDWLELAKVPELAKLLSASGETAAAPLVSPNPALLRRAATQQEQPAVKATTPSVKPMIAGRPVPAAKGSTKLGLPKFDPKKDQKAEAASLPKVDMEPVPQPAAKAPSATAVVPDMTPTLPRSPAAPVTPTHSRAEPQKIDIFAGADEEAPISIEPEFLRPPSPAPARAMQRAKALSPGTLGMKKPAPPPRPPMKSVPEAELPKQEPPKQEPPKQEPPKQETPTQGTAVRPKKAPPSPPRKAQPSAPAIVVAPEPALTPDPGTPSLGTLAAPARVEPKPAEPKRSIEGLLAAEELLVRALQLDPATTGAESREAPADEATTAPVAVQVSDVKAQARASTKPPAIETPTATRPASTSDAPVSEARPSAAAKAPPAKSRLPLVAAVGAAAVVAWLFMQGKRDTATPQPDPASQPAATVATEPATAAPAQPAEPTPPATEAPAPAMTAQAAPAEPAPEAPAAKPVVPAVAAPVKTETPSPKEPKPAEASPAPAKETAPKAETKPAEAKPAPAAAEPKEVAVGGEFDKAAAGTALSSAAQEASGCRKEGDPSGVAIVHVTFSNAGRATRAVIEGPPFAGTQTGGCIAATLRKATVPPYGGDRVTVTKKVVIH